MTLIGAILLYARTELFDSDAIAGSASAALSDASVRRALAPTVVGAIASVSPAGAPDPAVVAKALDDPRVKTAFGEAAGVAADNVRTDDSGTVQLDLGSTTVEALKSTAGIAPEDLGVATPEFDSARIDLVSAPALVDAIDAVERFGALGLVLVPLGLALLLLSILLARDRLRGLSAASLALAVAAGLLAAALYVGRQVVVAQFDDALTRDAVSGAWSALLGGLQSGAIVVGVAAVAIALVAGALASRAGRAY